MAQIQEGSKVPKVTFRVRENNEWKNVTTDDLFDIAARSECCGDRHRDGEQRAGDPGDDGEHSASRVEDGGPPVSVDAGGSERAAGPVRGRGPARHPARGRRR